VIYDLSVVSPCPNSSFATLSRTFLTTSPQQTKNLPTMLHVPSVFLCTQAAFENFQLKLNVIENDESAKWQKPISQHSAR